MILRLLTQTPRRERLPQRTLIHSLVAIRIRLNNRIPRTDERRVTRLERKPVQ
jgi:hypothetical protein